MFSTQDLKASFRLYQHRQRRELSASMRSIPSTLMRQLE